MAPHIPTIPLPSRHTPRPRQSPQCSHRQGPTRLSRPLIPLHFFLPFPVPFPACNASNKPSLPPVLLPHCLSRELNAPDHPGPSAGCWFFKPFRVLRYSCLCSCLTSLFPSFLPSRRSPAFKFFKIFLQSCVLPEVRSFFSARLLLHSLQPCMHVRFSGCAVIPIVIPYYSNYLYSI